MHYKKYYVITNGRTTGIFTDINYVRMQVNKFKNAKYKLFKNKYKAFEYFFSDKNNIEKYFLSQNYISDSIFDVKAYTDGSYNKNINTFTYGAVLFHNRHQIEMFAKFNNRKWSKLQNASGEMMGVIKVIDFCLQNNINSVLIYCDYKNLHFWLYKNKSFKCEEINLYKKYINEAKENNLIIAFKWIKSHSNNKYNDLADFLAKKAYNLNVFSQIYLK